MRLMIRPAICVMSSLWIGVSALAQSPLCDEGKVALLSTQKFISCDSVDFKKTAVSADYQSKLTAPLLAKPSQLVDASSGRRVYTNENPGILNAKIFFDADVSLMNKFYQYVDGQSKRSNDPSAQNFKQITSLLESNSFFEEQKSSVTEFDLHQKHFDWEGHCEIWSSWSLDPNIIRTMSKLKNGVLCSNIPFTKGEIKELITAFYPLPNFTDDQKLTQFYDPRAPSSDHKSLSEDRSREDANIALTKLGELGGGSRFTPASVLQMAKTALSKGENLIFGIDPGNQVWNQPMEEIVDITYQDSTATSSAGYQIQDFNAVESGVPNNTQGLIEKFAMLEADLKMMSLHGHVDSSCTVDRDPDSDQSKSVCLGEEICSVRRALQQTCDDLIDPGAREYDDRLGQYVIKPAYFNSPLSQQVDELWRLENLAIEKGAIQIHAPPIEHHKILIRYGVEGKFADSAQSKAQIRTLDYSKIGNRSEWAPPVKWLSQACADGSGDRNEGHNSLIANLSKECEALKSGSVSDREVFAGALPPKEFKSFVATPKFGLDDESQKKKKAYEQLLDMVNKNCTIFDDAASFLADLNQTLSHNEITPADGARLKSEYQKTRQLLDPAYVQDVIQQALEGSDPKKFVGLGEIFKPYPN